MLCLTRADREEIFIGDDIRIVICQSKQNWVKVGIEAPRDVLIIRGELRKPQNERGENDGEVTT